MGRIELTGARPSTPTGHPAKGTVGEVVPISVVIFRDGHDRVAGRARVRPKGSRTWTSVPLVGGDGERFTGTFRPEAVGHHDLVFEGWTDRFGTWREHTTKRAAAATSDLDVELLVGADLLDELAPLLPADRREVALGAAATLRSATCTTRTKLDAALDDRLADVLSEVVDPHDVTELATPGLWVDREAARFSAWYELFPRSESAADGTGGFKGAAQRLPAIAGMGFDIVYLPPIHPIARTNRKGRGNTLNPGPDDPGSPWAIGSEFGGHDAIHPDLGTEADFVAFRNEAERLGMEVALDYALQCSPDHPWVHEHPEWFRRRPDGSIRYSENPPKKYEDIHPIEFWPADDADRVALWTACRDVLEHWIALGVQVFRVDNPHTKPFAFWEWLLADIRSRHPEVLFLAEAFTRPRVMHTLAALGFTQSYTYFTWRTAAWELRQYGEELAQGDGADYFRPNFWTNTPDILAGPLRNGPPSAFRIRATLAATMSPSWGVYSGYELVENEPESDTNEEYRDSEKYELKRRDWAGAPVDLSGHLAALNAARRNHPALRELRTLRFHGSTDDAHLLVYSKTTPDGSDPVLVVVNLDPEGVREGLLQLDMDALGLPWSGSYRVRDELTGVRYRWEGPQPFVRLDPAAGVEAHVFAVGS